MTNVENTNIRVLFENEDYVFALKPVGVLSEGGVDGMDALLSEKYGKIYCVHRLDRAVSGVMVYARNKSAASYVSALISDGKLDKEYLAAVHGKAGAGEMVDLLFKDSRSNKSYVVKRVRKGVREARLEYETIAEKDGLSLVRIKLDTGRSHQIRVQFSSRRLPLFGDGKYGASDNSDIALFSHRISFKTSDGEVLSVSAYPDAVKPWDRFEEHMANKE